MAFESILGAAGNVIAGGLSFLGSERASDQLASAGQAAAQASAARPFLLPDLAALSINTGIAGAPFVGGPSGFGATLQSQLRGLGQAGLAQAGAIPGTFQFDLDPTRAEERQLALLRQRAAPGEAEARAALRSNLFGRGRLGLATRGGQTGAQVQPELAALEEGIARADLDRQLAAQTFAREDISQRLANAFSTLGAQLEIETLPLQLAAASSGLTSPASGQALLQAGTNRAAITQGLFTGLGQSVANIGRSFAGAFSPRPTTINPSITGGDLASILAPGGGFGGGTFNTGATFPQLNFDI